ncbi:MAG: hypothetical protein Q8P20_03010 [bacterium]|nr:hypothetical protein [bacterium]
MPSTNNKPSGISQKNISLLEKSRVNTKTRTPVPETSPELSSPEYTQETQSPMENLPIKDEGKFLDETIESLKTTLRGTKRKSTQIPQVRDEVTVKVEKIMEEGLADAFREMTPIQQQEFKIKGEKTAIEIRNVLRSGKVKIKKIFRLLIEWLKLLPGVNHFFLEQEAKIKADKIISLKKIDNNLNH